MNQQINRIDWQPMLFTDSVPKRIQLRNLVATWECNPKKVRIHRNHSFEYIETIIQPYLAYDGCKGEFIYSDYDDSLSWGSVDQSQSSDMEIIWLDFDRYINNFNDSQLIEWINQRIESLRQLTNSEILVANWVSDLHQTTSFNQQLAEIIIKLPGVWVYDQTKVWQELGTKYFDRRAAKLTGTNLSDQACILHGRELACRWIPALLQPRIKGILVDLDQTLYQGVLGEDGVDGVVLTRAHLVLQTELVRLQQTGIFLAIISRNEWQDVEQMFRSRSDFPLQLDHFSSFAVNWNDKGANVRIVAEQLRVSTDSLLFIDDNLGESISVMQQNPGIGSIFAISPQATLQALTWYPGIWSTGTSEADTLRVADLKTVVDRTRVLGESDNLHAYLDSLQVQLTFEINPLVQLQRLVELSQKTNQFNFSLQRLTAVELKSAIESKEYCVISIALKDRLSDSGIIGVVIGHYKQGQWLLKEICISCRALGRKLEDVVLAQSIQIMRQRRSSNIVAIEYNYAPRNSPALAWLKHNSADKLTDSTGIAILKRESVELNLTQYPIQIMIQDLTQVNILCPT